MELIYDIIDNYYNLVRKYKHLKNISEESKQLREAVDIFLLYILTNFGLPEVKFDRVNKYKLYMLLEETKSLDVAKKYVELIDTIPNKKGTMYPFLLDKTLIMQGQKQKYGTSIKININKDGVEEYYADVEDHAVVNKLRESVGLPPLEKHLEQTKQFYDKYLKGKLNTNSSNNK